MARHARRTAWRRVLPGAALLLAGAAAGPARATPKPPPAKKPVAEWTLPAGQIAPTTFGVSGDMRFVTYAISRGADPRRVTSREYCVADVTSGERWELLEAFPGQDPRQTGLRIRHVLPSPVGHLAFVTTVRGAYYTAGHVVDLATRKAWRPKERPLHQAAWAGPELIVSGARAPLPDVGTVGPIRRLTPFTDRGSALKLHGMALSSSADGKILLMAGDPNDLTSPVSTKQLRLRGMLLAVAADGKVLRAIGGARGIGTRPLISPGGKYAAYQRRPAKKGGPYSVEVVAAAGTQRWQIQGFLLPVAVLDTGQVVCRAAMFGPDMQPVTVHEAGGGARTLVPAAGDCWRVRDRLFYVVHEKRFRKPNKVRWVSLKPRPK
jgi:hypothetical protein